MGNMAGQLAVGWVRLETDLWRLNAVENHERLLGGEMKLGPRIQAPVPYGAVW